MNVHYFYKENLGVPYQFIKLLFSIVRGIVCNAIEVWKLLTIVPFYIGLGNSLGMLISDGLASLFQDVWVWILICHYFIKNK